MHCRKVYLGLIVAIVALFPALTQAVPTLNVTPGSIATDETDPVQLQVGALAGTQAILRLYTDADGDGVIDPEDYPIWADRIDDNVAPWSPAMFDDSAPAVGAVTVNVRAFGPFEFPYTSGDFIWQAVDSADSSSVTFPFSVTQAAQTQSVSGTVSDGALPVPGALVLLEPFCDQGDEARRGYSALADENGAYSIQVPGSLDCNRRLLIAARPGLMTSFAGQPDLEFTGSSTFLEDLQLTPGTRPVTGSVLYQTGPRIGQGIPGLTLTTEGDAGLISIAFTDENGDYGFTLADGDWEIESPEDRLSTRGAVGLEGEVAFTVSAGPPTVAPSLSLFAANAFFEGTLLDASTTALAGHSVSASRAWPCDPNCYETSFTTRTDGTFTLGV